MSEEWVTDPVALDVICALGLEIGDQVQLGSNVSDYGAMPTRAGKVATVTKAERAPTLGTRGSRGWLLWEEPQVAIATTHPEGGRFSLCRKIMVAWRRPPKNSQ